MEVTKLSLLLKVLEGEDGQTTQLSMERILPDLENNIKCGNSLIGEDFYDEQQGRLFDQDERRRINTFDWNSSFPAVFRDKNPGFDAVIGNPPYIRIQALKEFAPSEVEHYKKAYRSAAKGNYDIYVTFIEKGLELLNSSGRLGYILPNKFLTTDYGTNLRNLLAKSRVVASIVDFGHSQVFHSATTFTCLLFLDRSRPEDVSYTKVAEPFLLGGKSIVSSTIPSSLLGDKAWMFESEQTRNLLRKLNEKSLPLLELPAGMSRGTSTGADEIFCLKTKNGVLATKQGDILEIEDDLLRRPLYATDFTRYLFRPKNNERIIFPYIISEDGYTIVEEAEFRERWPKGYSYLSLNREKLDKRKQFRNWYGYSAPRNLHIHDRSDFLVPLLADRGLFAPVPMDASQFCVMASGGFSVSLLSDTGLLNSLYVIGVTNSKLLFWNLRLISNKFRGGWITCTKQYFGTLPIRIVDFSNPDDVAKHDRMVTLVERMLRLQGELQGAQSVWDRDRIKGSITATDYEIDHLVYELYGLSDEEIELVEAAK